MQWEFGDSIAFRWVMGGLARAFGDAYRDSSAGISGGRDCFDALISHWLDVADETGMPLDPRLWRRSPLTSTYPVCQAVKAATEQGPAAAEAYLRRSREAIFLERRKLDHAAALIAEAGNAGLDTSRFEIDLGSHAITEAFAADLTEVREVPEAAREAGKTGETEGKERVSFPSAVFVAEDGARNGVWGWQPYERYREAALAAGAEIATDRRPTVDEALERFGRCATLELEVLTGTPRPVLRGRAVEARLRVAAEARRRPHRDDVGTGVSARA